MKFFFRNSSYGDLSDRQRVLRVVVHQLRVEDGRLQEVGPHPDDLPKRRVRCQCGQGSILFEKYFRQKNGEEIGDFGFM
jgi:hypothetical protein